MTIPTEKVRSSCVRIKIHNEISATINKQLRGEGKGAEIKEEARREVEEE